MVWHELLEGDEFDTDILLQLQFDEHSVSTKSLTQSFGWTNMDAFTQHDVQELNRILSDKLEEKMKVLHTQNPGLCGNPSKQSYMTKNKNTGMPLPSSWSWLEYAHKRIGHLH